MANNKECLMVNHTISFAVLCVPTVVFACVSCARVSPSSSVVKSEVQDAATALANPGDAAVVYPQPIASVGATINFDAWRIPSPLCLAGTQFAGMLDGLFPASTDHWLAAGKYVLTGLDYYVAPRATPDGGPLEVTVGNWKLADSWSANAPATVQSMWYPCGAKACTVQLADPICQHLCDTEARHSLA